MRQVLELFLRREVPLLEASRVVLLPPDHLRGRRRVGSTQGLRPNLEYDPIEQRYRHGRVGRIGCANCGATNVIFPKVYESTRRHFCHNCPAVLTPYGTWV